MLVKKNNKYCIDIIEMINNLRQKNSKEHIYREMGKILVMKQ